MSEYEAVIGLEIHAEMLTESKMFSGCEVVDSVTSPPNTAVDPLSLGMPGMLPVVNRRAVEMAMKVGMALNCDINRYNAFDRKNYFYPDLAKSYQITQLASPIATNGYVDIELSSGETKRIRVRQAHMEEDTGKLTHLGDGTSLVDYNRAGVPLLEIVSEPDICNAEEALAYATKIRQIVQYLDVNTGDMEKGIIRFEANISVRPQGTDELNTRVEVKNLNSFRALTESINYQIAEQVGLVRNGREVIQATAGWDESRKATFIQRTKEDAHDYRYFPDPDLPPLFISEEWVAEVREQLVELPDTKIGRYRSDLGLSDYDATKLAEDRVAAEWFEAVVAAGAEAKAAANWIINNLSALMNEHKQTISEIKVTPAGLAALIGLVKKDTISNNAAKQVLIEMFESGKAAQAIVDEKGLAQVSDTSMLEGMIAQILADNQDSVQAYLGGKTKLKGFFTGQIMRQTKGKANPKVVNQMLDAALEAQREG